MRRLLAHPALLGMGLVLITLAVYWPGLTGPFLFDDYPNIVNNPLIQIDTLDWESLKRAARGYVPGHIGRPLATIGLALDFLAWGKDPWGYKLHSLIVHILNAILVFALVRKMALVPQSGWSARSATLAAAAIALVWATHPLQVSSVLYVVQRMETLCYTFVLLGLIAYLHGRLRQLDGKAGAAWLVGSFLLAGIGLLAKESAALFPAYTLALELTLLSFAGAQPAFAKRLKITYGVAALAGLAVFLTFVLPAYLASGAYGGRDFNAVERLLTQLRILPMYLGQMLFPLPRHMVFYYDQIEASKTLLNPITTLFGGLFLLGLTALSLTIRRKAPFTSVGIFWFLFAHAITSNVIPLELAFEHRNYFALLGILLAVVDIVRLIPARDPTAKLVGAFACAMFVVFLCGVRASIWGNEFHLHLDLVSNNPESPRASSDLATFYVGMSDGNPSSPFYAWGIREFERASRLPRSSPLPEQGLILSAATTGQPVPDEWWQSLIAKLESRPIGIQEGLAVVGLLTQRSSGIELDDRRLAQAYTILSRRSTQPASYYAFMGDHAINVLGDETLATDLFVKAIERCEGNPTYARQIIRALTNEGHAQIASVALSRATALGILSDGD
jgi:hypothetical protein